MWNPARTPFGAIFRTELLLNTRRVAPYAMALVCACNALLWWGWGPAESRGWAVNSEHFVAGMLPVFSFMTLPLFTAVIMGDPVIRDLRANVTPLIFSKPLGRASYLLGKFSGNFFVLACCQAAFPVTLCVLQAFRRPRMIVLEPRFLPYFKHFLLLVVLSHLLLAAFYFAVGTLTRNAKIVYALAVAFYPVYIAYHVALLNTLPARWRVALDPLLMDWQREAVSGLPAALIDRLPVAYHADVIANRASVILLAAACLAVLHARFTKSARRGDEARGRPTLLNLSAAEDRLYTDPRGASVARGANTARDSLLGRAIRAGDARARDEDASLGDAASIPRVNKEAAPIPRVNISAAGPRAGFAKLIAAFCVEFRLLRAERSLFVLAPLAVSLSLLELAFYPVTPAPTYSAAYASGAARALLLFLLGAVVFYTGESMHRDRELRVEPLLWAAPTPNSALLLSKFLAALLLSLSLVALNSLAAVAVQLARGHVPVELAPYFLVDCVILAPTVIFAACASVALNVFSRDKHLAYAASVAAVVGLYYLYGRGHAHPLYNPALYGLWSYADLAATGGGEHARLLLHRLYCLALAALFLSLAHLGFPRRQSGADAHARRRLGGKSVALLLVAVSLAVAVALGFLISTAS